MTVQPTNAPSFKPGTKPALFVELAQPDANGVSRWVNKSEFTDKFSPLMFQNGADWCRKESSIAKHYILEFDKSLTPGNGVDRIRLNGYRKAEDRLGNQTIRSDIKNHYKAQRCVVLGTSNPEVDHKNGWKNDDKVMKSTTTQQMSDFQPLSKATNDAKRQFCKECRRTGQRFDATQLGYPMSYYKGCAQHDGTPSGCEGCFWYDPLEFRRHLRPINEPQVNNTENLTNDTSVNPPHQTDTKLYPTENS